MTRMHRTRSRLAAASVLGATLAMSLVALGSTATAAPAEGAVRNAGGADAVANSYIVVLKDKVRTAAAVSAEAGALAQQYQGKVGLVYATALQGFSVEMTEAQAKKLAGNPDVDYVEQNKTVRISGTQPNPTWGLDRIDQRDLPLDKSYTYPSSAGVTAYIIDTGVRQTHQDFGGRARSGRDFIDNDDNTDDCQGHGTHVAGTVAGSAYGVAKDAKVVGVRVLNCQGSGTWAQVIAGVDWTAANAVKPAVANMSLGGGANDALDTAIKNAIAKGITFAIAAGNGDIFGRPQDACTVSPARTPEAITVGATQNTDASASFSNFGTCLDIWAPGVGITSAWKDSDTATNTISGTSMATPHVAGGAALVLAANPTFTPAQVRDKLVADATNGKVTNPGAGSPNKLLFVGGGGTTPPPTCDAVTSGGAVAIGDLKTVESPVVVARCDGNATSVKAEVKITHTYRGDLVIDLIAPDNTAFRVKNSSAYDSADNVNETYTVNVGGKVKNGTWKLRVQDVARGDSGSIDTWTLRF